MTVAVVLVAVLAVTGFGVVALRGVLDDVRLARARHCTVTAQGEVGLDAEQMANAATIAAVGFRLRMPDRAVVVALATALQESKLRNLPGGDRDSVGLFQQRPSTGWGSPKQIRNPRYAARKFYLGLAKVPGWETMRITDAAQRVQRSAFPTAYQKWADEAEILTRALLGRSSGAVACAVSRGGGPVAGTATTSLLRGLRLDWGGLVTDAADPQGVTLAATNARDGWRYAHWLVSHAAQHGVARVAYADLEWTAEHGRWRRSGSPTDQVTAAVFRS